MNTKNNQRSKETKNCILNIFCELLKQKNISKITVQEVCQKADINRSTFYAHYRDIYDLLENIENDMERQIKDIFYDKNNTSGWGLPEHCFENLFYFILENIDFYKAYVKNTSKNYILTFSIFTSYENQLQPLFRRIGIHNEIEAIYRIKYFMGGLNAIIHEWIGTGCQESPEDLANFIYGEYSLIK